MFCVCVLVVTDCHRNRLRLVEAPVANRLISDLTADPARGRSSCRRSDRSFGSRKTHLPCCRQWAGMNISRRPKTSVREDRLATTNGWSHNHIVDHDFTDAVKTAIECLVKWHRWTDAHNSVVPLSEIGHGSSLVRDYIRVREKRKLRELCLVGKLVSSALVRIDQLKAEHCCNNYWHVIDQRA